MPRKRAVVSFDREASCFTGLTDDILKKFRVAFPGVNIEAEVAKMSLWLLSPKGSKRQGTIAFMMAWLGRAKPTLLDTLDSLDVYKDYTEKLWH